LLRFKRTFRKSAAKIQRTFMSEASGKSAAKIQRTFISEASRKSEENLLPLLKIEMLLLFIIN